MRANVTFITTEGGLLPDDLLRRLRFDEGKLEGLSAADYHLAGEKLSSAISRSWSRVLLAWNAFAAAEKKLAKDESGVGPTREKWLLPLFLELGYGRLQGAKSYEIDEKLYPISHRWRAVPIHLVGCNESLDLRVALSADAPKMTPHGMLQELLNRTPEALWGFVSNGRTLRVLRDSVSLTRQAYVEFDLEGMMNAQAFSDFSVLWLLCHESRVEADKPEEMWLEKWTKVAREQGTRALDALRDGVERALNRLGQGFVSHPANGALRAALSSGRLSPQDYYRELLRLAYRLIFLCVAEDRDVLLLPNAPEASKRSYREWYSLRRLRRLVERVRGDKHDDGWRALRLVFAKLGMDTGCPELALPALGSFLWSNTATPFLDAAQIENAYLFDALRALTFTEQDRVRRYIDYKNLGAEELGSVYEGLLELHPRLDLDAGLFELANVAGSERKTTGSYYTPSSLVSCLLDSALMPVLDEAAAKPNAEQAILSLSVVDPACGSGHFLIAAAHRIAKRLAQVRTGDEEPAPIDVRRALRDVIGHCIYGVDLNEMAVELCKVSLWMEAVEPGKPLSFLDSKIRCGNALLGATPELITKGIPDEAYVALEGDEKAVVLAWKKKNKAAREGQMSLGLSRRATTDIPLSEEVHSLDALADDSIAAVHEKERALARIEHSDVYEREKLAADLWCAAFVWEKRIANGEMPDAVTTETVRLAAENPDAVVPATRAQCAGYAALHRFFHWHIAFPNVFAHGGFDVVLGNPPWEHLELKEEEWFAQRSSAIAGATNAAVRKRRIAALASEDRSLYLAYKAAFRSFEAETHLLRASGRYPLCAKGRINTYAIFAEHNRRLLGQRGRAGFIVPSGIATDDTTKDFFATLVREQILTSLYDFQSGPGLFGDIGHARFKFCLLGLGMGRVSADLVFFARSVGDLGDPERHFSLARGDFETLNPNTRTCPTFRSRRDADINLAMYRRAGVLWREGDAEHGNPWGLRFMQGVFNMASDCRRSG